VGLKSFALRTHKDFGIWRSFASRKTKENVNDFLLAKSQGANY
jgi:hypothetical protein